MGYGRKNKNFFLLTDSPRRLCANALALSFLAARRGTGLIPTMGIYLAHSFVFCKRLTIAICHGAHCSRPARSVRLRRFRPNAPGAGQGAARAPIRAAASRRRAQVAQLVEHVTENHGVGGSIPPLGTSKIEDLSESRRSRVSYGTTFRTTIEGLRRATVETSTKFPARAPLSPASRSRRCSSARAGPIQAAGALTRMIGITISGKAYAAIADTLPARSAVEKEMAPDGEYYVWLPRTAVKRLLAQREAGETFSEVILRLVERGAYATITR